tara:strand:- start:355 stop:822 length:468 start_codon:yes stop_codon:yes gene_type:complete
MFKQEVLIKEVLPSEVIESFHNKDFVTFLIKFQPVKIMAWDGIKSGKLAEFKFWFFGWKKMNVIHKNYVLKSNHLSFEDHGSLLPFGLKNWKHKHIVEKVNEGTLITDLVSFNGGGIAKIFIKPIMLFPIALRRITYKIWFYYFNKTKGNFNGEK